MMRFGCKMPALSYVHDRARARAFARGAHTSALCSKTFFARGNDKAALQAASSRIGIG